MRECSRKRPTTERTRMLFVSPSMPGGSEQAPRTMRSMLAPAWPAATRASISVVSVSALTLTTMRAGLPARAASPTCAMCASSRLCSTKGAVSRWRGGFMRVRLAICWKIWSASAVMPSSALR
jgi:hypothetical protein